MGFTFTDITSPTTDAVRFADKNGGNTLILETLREPSIIPEMEESLRVSEHHTRPSSPSNGGYRTVALYPSSSNQGNVHFNIPILQNSEYNILQSWRRSAPPLVRWTNDVIIWYVGYMIVLRRVNYKFNQRVFGGAEVHIEFLGTV